MYFHKFPFMFVYTFHITIFDFYRYNRYQISILHFRVLSFIQLIQFKPIFTFM